MNMNRNTMENNETLAKLHSLGSECNLNIEGKILRSATVCFTFRPLINIKKKYCTIVSFDNRR